MSRNLVPSRMLAALSWPHPYFKLNLCFSKVKHAFPQMSSKYGSSYTEQVILQFTCVSCWAGVNIQLHSADEIVRAQGLPHHARVTLKLSAIFTWYLSYSLVFSFLFLFVYRKNHRCVLCLESEAFAFVLNYIDITKMVITRSNLHFFNICHFNAQKLYFPHLLT